MTDTNRPRTRRRPSRRARSIVAGVSALAFVGLGTTMALAGTGGNSNAPAPTGSRVSVDPFTSARGDDTYGGRVTGGSDDSGFWGAQPPTGFAAPSASNAGANTATHGS